jgi:hypothetical protein
MNRKKMWPVSAVLIGLLMVQLQSAVASPPDGKESALKASEITGKIFPDQVFFRGQVAPVQMRNTAGIRFSDDAYVLGGLVDSSGYSSDIRQKYQGYLITEVALEIGGQKLPAGAYGFGFVAGGKFIAMDLGAHDVLQASSTKDTEMKRPVPLQIVSTGGKYRLYSGRDYVEVSRAR